MFLLEFFCMVYEILYRGEQRVTECLNEHLSVLQCAYYHHSAANVTRTELFKNKIMPREFHDYIYSKYAPYFGMVLNPGPRDMFYYDAYALHP